jgi:diguanylate cyclase (GGDEF)-like protein
MIPLYDRPGIPRYWMGSEQRPVAAEQVGADNEREILLAVLRDASMQLRRLDGRDSVTGVLNRRAFDELLQRDWVMARREQRSLSAILLRLDDFADYREVYGRHAADSCLRKVLHAITGSLRRGGDLVARYGDDRFVVLLNGGEEEHVARLADQIAARVRGLSIHHPRSAQGRFMTASYGLSHMRPDAKNSPEKLLTIADKDLEANHPAGTDIAAVDKVAG